MSINSYADLVAALPWQRNPANPLVTSPQPGGYVNINPCGVIIDPLDGSKFLLYVGEFQQAWVTDGITHNNGKISLFRGSVTDPNNLTFVGDVITPATFGQEVTYGSVVAVGTTVYLYFNVSVLGDIHMATSTDGGRTFTINMTPLLVPNSAANEGGFEIPFVTDFGNGSTWYMYSTVRMPASGGYDFLYQEVATASSPTGPWTRQHINSIPDGTGGDFAVRVEGASYYKIGSDYIALYSGFGADGIFRVGLAHSAGPLEVFTADTAINPVFEGTGNPTDWDWYGAVCPILVTLGGTLSMYYAGFSDDLWTTNRFQVGSAVIGAINGGVFPGITKTATCTAALGTFVGVQNGAFSGLNLQDAASETLGQFTVAYPLGNGAFSGLALNESVTVALGALRSSNQIRAPNGGIWRKAFPPYEPINLKQFRDGTWQ